MPLNHEISMKYKPADGTHAPTHTTIGFTRWEHEDATVQGQLQMGRNGREFRDGSERGVF